MKTKKKNTDHVDPAESIRVESRALVAQALTEWPSIIKNAARGAYETPAKLTKTLDLLGLDLEQYERAVDAQRRVDAIRTLVGDLPQPDEQAEADQQAIIEQLEGSKAAAIAHWDEQIARANERLAEYQARSPRILEGRRRLREAEESLERVLDGGPVDRPKPAPTPRRRPTVTRLRDDGHHMARAARAAREAGWSDYEPSHTRHTSRGGGIVYKIGANVVSRSDDFLEQ